jgi:hypothetical protein
MNGVYPSGPPYRILLSEWLHDIRHNDNQHNGLICNTAFMIFSINDIEHNIFGVIMLRVVKVNVVVRSVVMLNVITLSVIMLNVATPSE